MNSNAAKSRLEATLRRARKYGPVPDSVKINSCPYCQLAIKEWHNGTPEGFQLMAGRIGWAVKQWGFNPVRKAIVETRRRNPENPQAYLTRILNNPVSMEAYKLGKELE